MKRLWIFVLPLLLLLPLAITEMTIAQTLPTSTPIFTTPTIEPQVFVESTSSSNLAVTQEVIEDTGNLNAPHFVSGETYALVWVERANLRTQPSTEEGRVVDIALAGETFTIIGVFYPDENTVIDPETRELVFDNTNEREVWYLVEVNGGAAWIFGGVVLVANPDDLPVGLRELTPEEEARLQQQLFEISGTIAVRNTLRLRGGPGTGYRVLGVIPFGGRVTIIGRNEFGTWAYIDYHATQGWVSSMYLAFPPAYHFELVPVIG